MTAARPHRLALYRAAVQHPDAEVRFLLRAFEHYFPDAPVGGRLREDFAGTAAVAAAWVQLDDNHRALAVDNHGPTVRWAQRQATRELGERMQDLHIIQADVLDLAAPKVDIVAALNFSTFIYHDREALRQYFRHARRCLRKPGLLVIDAFGGPGAMRIGTQRRNATLDAPPGSTTPTAADAPFIYEWEQRSHDPVTARIDCRIHFEWPVGRRRKRIENAFVYNWRLWTLPELRELMLEAGFAACDVWCDRITKSGRTDGIYRPTASIPAREDWIAYVVGAK